MTAPTRYQFLRFVLAPVRAAGWLAGALYAHWRAGFWEGRQWGDGE